MSLREPFAGNRAHQVEAYLAASSSKQPASTPEPGSAPAGSHLAQPGEHVNVRPPKQPDLDLLTQARQAIEAERLREEGREDRDGWSHGFAHGLAVARDLIAQQQCLQGGGEA